MNADNDRDTDEGKNGTKPDGRSEVRILLHNHDVSILIGRGGVNIKALREEQKTIIQLPDSHGPERLLIVKGNLEACRSTLKAVFSLLGKDRRYERGEAECRFLIHQSHAGPFIGHNGDHVKELRKKFELDIKVFSRRCPMSTDRVVLLRGPIDHLIDCIIDTIQMAESHPIKGPNQPYDPYNADDFLAEEYGGFVDERRVRDSRQQIDTLRSSGHAAEALMRMLPHPWGLRSSMDDSKKRRMLSPERDYPPMRAPAVFDDGGRRMELMRRLDNFRTPHYAAPGPFDRERPSYMYDRRMRDRSPRRSRSNVHRSRSPGRFGR